MANHDRQLKNLLKDKLANMKSHLDRLDHQHMNMEEKLESMKTKIKSMEIRFQSMATRILSMKTQMKALGTQMTSIEIQMQSIEERIHTLEKGIEEQDPMSDAEKKDTISVTKPLQLYPFSMQIESDREFV